MIASEHENEVPERRVSRMKSQNSMPTKRIARDGYLYDVQEMVSYSAGREGKPVRKGRCSNTFLRPRTYNDRIFFQSMNTHRTPHSSSPFHIGFSLFLRARSRLVGLWWWEKRASRRCRNHRR